MIERSQRPVTRHLIGRFAEVFEVSIDVLSDDDDTRLLSDLLELFGDPVLALNAVSREEIEELVGGAPAAARALVTLHHLYRGVRGEVDFFARTHDRGRFPLHLRPRTSVGAHADSFLR